MLGICLGLAAAVVAAVLLASSNSAKPRSAGAATAPRGAADPGSFGCTIGTAGLCDAAGVQARLGQPTRRQGHCWVYRFDKAAKRIHVAPETDAWKFCFSTSGAVTALYDHYQGRWFPEIGFAPSPVYPAPSQL